MVRGAREHTSIVCHLAARHLSSPLRLGISLAKRFQHIGKALWGSSYASERIIRLDHQRRHQIVLLYHALSMQPGRQTNSPPHVPLTSTLKHLQNTSEPRSCQQQPATVLLNGLAMINNRP
jgi:hypothetical protein